MTVLPQLVRGSMQMFEAGESDHCGSRSLSGHACTARKSLQRVTWLVGNQCVSNNADTC